MKLIAWVCSVMALCSAVFAYSIIRSGSPSAGFESAIWVGALLFWSGTLAVAAAGLLCVVSLKAHGALAGPAPRHLWLVGLSMLIWNAMACASHVLTLTQNAAYFRSTGLTPAMAAYFAAVPAWYVVAWTIGVWGGVVAAVALLRRKSWTVWWVAASQLAMVINSVWTLLNPDARVLGKVGSIGAIATIALGAFLVLYSMAMKRRGVLR